MKGSLRKYIYQFEYYEGGKDVPYYKVHADGYFQFLRTYLIVMYKNFIYSEFH